jgi:hypothetical protein
MAKALFSLGILLASPSLFAAIRSSGDLEIPKRLENLSKFEALVWSGCLAFDKDANTWYMFPQSFAGTKCEFEEIELDQIELANLRTSPITLAC